MLPKFNKSPKSYIVKKPYMLYVEVRGAAAQKEAMSYAGLRFGH